MEAAAGDPQRQRIIRQLHLEKSAADLEAGDDTFSVAVVQSPTTTPSDELADFLAERRAL